MANIMITERCNLKCPYCFANEFVNKRTSDISLENFQDAVNFISTDKSGHVGIIGGEPYLHPQFQQLMEILINNQRIRHVVLFTNGVYVDKFIKLLTNEKFSLLINCNPATSIGKEAYKKLQNNLDLLINEYYLKARITLGINMYRPDFEYAYMIELLTKYKFNHVRTSIVVPNTDGQRSTNPLEYFRKIKPSVKSFFGELAKMGILPHYDCNLVPACILEEYEKEQIINILSSQQIKQTNLLGENAICHPVIDILPDLMAVRCFGLSGYHKVSITEFRNISELHYYFLNNFDVFAYNTVASEECIECKKRKTMRCTGGCIAFKMPQIQKVREYASNIIHDKGDNYGT